MQLVPKKGLSWLVYAGLLATACMWMLLSAVGLYGVFWWWYNPRHQIKDRISFYSENGQMVFPMAIPALDIQVQDYEVDLVLGIPYSQQNINAGTFGVEAFVKADTEPFASCGWDDASLCLTNIANYRPSPKMLGLLVSTHPSTRALAWSQMATLPYKSELVHYMDAVVFAPLYLLGLKQQNSNVKVPLFRNIKVPLSKFNYAQIVINTELQLESATLMWTVRPKGLQRLIHNYPTLSFFAGVGFIWFWELLLALITVLRIIKPFSDEPEEEEPVDEQSQGQSEGIRLTGQQVQNLIDLSRRIDEYESARRRSRGRRAARKYTVGSRGSSKWRAERPSQHNSATDERWSFIRSMANSEEAHTLRSLFSRSSSAGASSATSLSSGSGSAGRSRGTSAGSAGSAGSGSSGSAGAGRHFEPASGLGTSGSGFSFTFNRGDASLRYRRPG